MWIERTTLDISSPLPGILRWFEVKQKSVQEITPVEFACETMNNVGKELWDLIVQYRSEPKRNINPFSMRLQGIIDANVMGGISKYQEAFFTEQFLKSPQGHGQQANVQKLKGLILEQILVLEQALELHGQLAPSGVQPLHNRLLERFSQLKQSLSGLGRLKRQHSESIVNTPLPPLPTEKRTMSLGSGSSSNTIPAPLTSNSYAFYEHDDIYTRPGDMLRPVETGGNNSLGYIAVHNSYQTLSKESLSIPEITNQQHPAPPVPNRPRSTGFVGSIDSPEVPPKRNLNQPGSPTAPPLPPRGITPDKRASNPIILNDFSAHITTESPMSSMQRRMQSNQHSQQQQISMLQQQHQQSHGQKYAVVDISFDDPESDHFQQHQHSRTPQMTNNIDPAHLNVCYAPHDFRDSGISTTSSNEFNQLNNFNDDTSSNTTHREHCRMSSNGGLETAPFSLNNTGFNINHRENSANSFDMEDLPMPPPPPIPPKSLNVIGMNDTHAQHLSLEEQLNLNLSMQHTHVQEHTHHHNHHNGGTAVGDGYVAPKTIGATVNTNSPNGGDGSTF